MKSKKNPLVFWISILLFGIAVQGCTKRTQVRTFVGNSPLYMSYDELRGSVDYSEAQEIADPGKIYIKDQYLFINERYKGVHVIDNSNPAAPKEIVFINILGNLDIAVKENTLYADSYADVVVIDISDINNPKEVNRVENTLEQVLPPWNPDYPVAEVIDFEEGIVVGWEIKEVKEKVEIEAGSRRNGCRTCFGREDVLIDFSNSQSVTTFENNSSVKIAPQTMGTGKGGSMSRFTISQNRLYVMNNNTLKVFDIDNADNPIITSVTEILREVETLFPYEDKLFMGTTSGMLIYDISSPDSPTYISVFDHVVSCDPVVVDGDVAYVTLRSGTDCGRWTNQLDVIDISNITSPTLINTFSMTAPQGLGVDNETLFLCDGDDGLKVFDVTDPLTVGDNMIHHFGGINAMDVIPFNNLLMMIGEDGLYQYNYTDKNNPELVGTILVGDKL